MQQRHDKVPEKGRHDRRLMGAAAAMFIVAAGVFGGTMYLQNRAQQMASPRVRVSTAPDLTPQEKAQSVTRARELREKWRPWALKHQAELTRMLNAKSGDQAALAAVWDAVPTVPNDPGFKIEDLSPPGIQPPSPVGFSWAGLSKVPVAEGSSSSKSVQENISKGQLSGLSQVQQSFNKYHDIVVAESLTNRTQIQLWASGRISENNRRPASEKKKLIEEAKSEGRPFTIDDMRTPYQPVEPPYDFLPLNSVKETS